MTGTIDGARTAPRRITTIDLAGRVTALEGELVSSKRVPRGHAVSYGGEYVTSAATRLGLVAIGYADGIPRSATGSPITVDGVRYPVCGRVSMDQVVVDLGDADPAPGTRCIAWGPGGVTVAEFADASGVPVAALEAFVGPRSVVQIEGTVQSADETEALGAAIGARLVAGDAVVLTGQLGAGKTTLTRGLGRALGAVGHIQSPTFVIARTHETATAPLVHLDAYRLGTEAELDDLDLDLDGSITVAEWGLPLVHSLDSYLRVDLERRGGDSDAVSHDDADDIDEPRTVRITGHGPGWQGSRLLGIMEHA